jgi:aminopeptidase N
MPTSTMHRCTIVAFSILLLGTVFTSLPFSGTSHASEQLGRECVCRYCAMRPKGRVKASANGRHYTPDRVVDVLHVAIDITPDFRRRTIAATTTLNFVPIARPVDSIRLHAYDLDVQKISGSVAVAGYELRPQGIEITFKKPIPAGQKASVTVVYKTEPKDGLYFRTPEMGYRAEDVHLWTQGEPHLARHWFPSFDYPNEKFTSEITCRVPPEMTVVSNGSLVGEKIDDKLGLKAVHWHQKQPHVNYLVALVAGKFHKIEGRHRDIPLRFFTPASQIKNAKNSFRDTADMMAFFEKETGTPYPWAKYDQVVVDDFMWGGMENTTITILNDRTLFSEETENLRSSQYLVAHELAHQWFGNYVTCKDWSHLWLNEGFAVYYSHLYQQHKHGHDAFLYSLYNDRRGLAGNKSERRPIVYKAYETAWEQFDSRAYGKGSWVLHMLRTRLGEDLYRRGIREYLKRNAFRSVVTQDLQNVLEEVSGLSLQHFFDQWVYHAGHPQLTVSQNWDPNTQLAKITVQQTQKTDDKVLLFRFPVKLRFQTKKGTVERVVEVTRKREDFYVPLLAKPDIVRFDADLGVLASVTFKKPKAMLYAQLADRKDVVGRLLAIESLKSKDDAETVEKLKTALNEDPFYGVRVAASQALRAIKTGAARKALIASLHQNDARVRRQVVSDLGAFFHPDAKLRIASVLESEKNPDIRAVAIRSLGKYQDKETYRRIMSLLGSRSYRNGLASAAIDTIRQLDDPTFIAPLMMMLSKREADFPSRQFGSALDTLAYIARHQDNRNSVRNFLAGYLLHPKQSLRIAAISALGTLRDPKAIAVVASFDVGPAGNRIKSAATDAIKKLREAKKLPVELGDLRSTVGDLKQSNEKLRKEMDELKKQLKAIADRKKPGEKDNEPKNDSRAKQAE